MSIEVDAGGCAGSSCKQPNVSGSMGFVRPRKPLPSMKSGKRDEREIPTTSRTPSDGTYGNDFNAYMMHIGDQISIQDLPMEIVEELFSMWNRCIADKKLFECIDTSDEVTLFNELKNLVNKVAICDDPDLLQEEVTKFNDTFTTVVFSFKYSNYIYKSLVPYLKNVIIVKLNTLMESGLDKSTNHRLRDKLETIIDFNTISDEFGLDGRDERAWYYNRLSDVLELIPKRIEDIRANGIADNNYIQYGICGSIGLLVGILITTFR